ncbi:hypothetical protein C1H46_036501 [Malus baccata]|uniref:Uncharacterized protein n=1 Tax=Malus baccata TaxID=106549 RepID=A0A540KUR6_MALBA|nr:hypothetical protein C1H46_036501 [Malus baccata]
MHLTITNDCFKFSMSSLDSPYSFPDDLNWHTRIDLRTGNLRVLRLCHCCVMRAEADAEVSL